MLICIPFVSKDRKMYLFFHAHQYVWLNATNHSVHYFYCFIIASIVSLPYNFKSVQVSLLCLFIWEGACATAHTWKSKNNFGKSVLSFYHVGLGSKLTSSGLDLYWLSCPTGPRVSLILKEASHLNTFFSFNCDPVFCLSHTPTSQASWEFLPSLLAVSLPPFMHYLTYGLLFLPRY